VRDGAVESHDRRRIAGDEQIVESEHVEPVGVGRGVRVGVR
jgi:hypothetical protein